MSGRDAQHPPGPAPVGGIPARAWLRPGLLLTGGLLLAAVLLLVDQPIGAVLLAVFALFMGYWTSPLRSGEHTPLDAAIAARPRTGGVILWAPGDPLSARLQTALRSPRADVAWVNVYRDADAARLLGEHGGRDSLPLVLVGDGTVLRAATVGQLLDALAAAQDSGLDPGPPAGSLTA